MKIVAVFARVRLQQKPDWLESFYAKYSAAHDYHVTLKQACFIEDAEVEKIKQTFLATLNSFKVQKQKIDVVFDRLVIGLEVKGERSIMIAAKENPVLFQLQKRLVSALTHCKRYVTKESEEWERNFMPHITIAPDIDASQYASARSELGQDFYCVGEIDEIVLAVVNVGGPRTTENSQDHTVFHL